MSCELGICVHSSMSCDWVQRDALENQCRVGMVDITFGDLHNPQASQLCLALLVHIIVT